MTNQERAEKIGYEVIEEICHVVDRNIYSEDILKAIVPEITSQLDEAVKEHFHQMEHVWHEESYAEGFFAAREKAAGIADKFDHDDPYTDCCGAEIAIAERIRAMEEICGS